MKKTFLFFIVFFTNLVAIAQPEKEKMEQLKAQLEMIQKRGDSMMKALKKGTVKPPAAKPLITGDADQFKPGLNSFERATLRLPDSAKIRLMPKKIYPKRSWVNTLLICTS